nr:hypothetical protein [Nocardioides alcanivorans]
MKLKPWARLVEPKVKRSDPEVGSMPTVAMASPAATMATDLEVDPVDRATSSTRPAMQRAMYSGGPSLTARSPRIGAKNISMTTAMVPAMKDDTAAMVSAAPARPFLVIA